MPKKSKISKIKHLLFVLSVLFLVISLVVIIAVSFFIREKAVSELATNEAYKSAELVVQGLYTVMRKGWSKEEIRDIVDRFNAVDKDMTVRVIRGEVVEKQFGTNPLVGGDIETDPIMQEIFLNGEEKLLESSQSLRFLFPVKADTECLVCHFQSKVGSIHGIIDITFQTSRLKLPLDYILRSVVSFFAIAFCILFFILFYMLRSGIIRPVTHMVAIINDIMDKRDLSLRVHYQGRVAEFKQLGGFFNEMLSMLESSHHDLEKQSTHDHLTDLYNRRKFEEDLENEILLAARYQRKFSLVMVDLDDFKRVNDEYGHAAGDSVLIRFSNVLKENIRGSDLVARLGGDEFCILLHETNCDMATEVCKNIQQFLAENPLEFQGEHYAIVGSFGIAGYPQHGTESETLMQAADKAMYQAKRDGKNQLAVATQQD